MKYCPNCGSTMADEATFCASCGNALAAPQPAQYVQPEPAPQPTYAPQQPTYAPQPGYTQPGYAPQPGYAQPGYAPQPGYGPGYGYTPAPPKVDETDHTADYDKEDISDSKVVGIFMYLMGFIGILIAVLMSSESKVTKFHVRQALKIEVVNLLWTVGCVAVGAVLSWLLLLGEAAIAWIALMGMCFSVGTIGILVIRILAFVNICKGKVKEAPLVCNLKFLK